MPKRKNKTMDKHAELRTTMKKPKQTQNTPARPVGDARAEMFQDDINKRLLTLQLPHTTPTVSPLPHLLEQNVVVINTDENPTNNIEESLSSSRSPSMLPPSMFADEVEQNEKNTKSNNIQVTAQIHTNIIGNPVPASKNITTAKATNTNGAIFSEPDTIEMINTVSQLKPLPNTLLSNMSSSEIFSLPVIVIDDIIAENITPSDAAVMNSETHLTQPSSTRTQDIVLRTSHDPKDMAEDIDLDVIEVEHSLDASTPIASPSISTIMRNIEAENLSFSNINTPTSSICVSPSVNDKTFVLSHCDGDTTDASDLEERQSKKKRKVKRKTNLVKTRKARCHEWIDTKRKVLKNLGLTYTSRGGKERPAKSMLSGCDEKCRLKCKEKINEYVREQLFSRFWSLGNRVRQWGLLSRWCERIGKKRMTTEGPSKRHYSIKYYLPITVESNKEERVLVCKTMFLHTFAVGEGVVRTAINKITQGDGLLVERDLRGHHANHVKVINEEMVKSVCDHVKSFNPVEAHYTRKESSKLYLDSNLTLSRMFELYEEWVSGSDLNRAKTRRQYTDIVNDNFNIEFHRPKKDQCDECIAYKNLPKPINQDDQDRYNEHVRNKDLARSLKNENKLTALRSPSTTVTAAFDFQKVHSAPHAETSILYYKRKLNVFNFTIFEMGQKVGKCYMWHEGTAKRGANEVASCVYDFIRDQALKGIQIINLYSDNCGGQNRNRIVFLMYLLAAKQFKVNITHRFFEKGHTQNENDSIHALIERCAKHKEIYTPDQWFSLVRWAKETGNPYIVKEVATEDVLDFKKLLIGKNWTKNERNQKIMWSKIRELNVSFSEPDVIQYKYQFDETYLRLVVGRTQNRRRQSQTTEQLTQAYTGPLPIPHAKVADLKYLCEHNIIPRQYHGFFNSLVAGVEELESDED